MPERADQAAEAVQVHCHLYDHAEERRRSAHGQLLLLEQRNGRILYGALGEQDDVLHRVRVWAVDLRDFFYYIYYCASLFVQLE